MPSILIVCTANVCRSPMAEIRMRGLLVAAGMPAFRVSSAGSAAEGGRAMCPVARQELEAGSVDGARAAAHVSRRLTREVLDDADLVLVPDLSNRARVVSLQPVVRRRTFTLREFAHAVSASGSILAPPTVRSPEGCEQRQGFANWVDATYSARSLAQAPTTARFLRRAHAIRGVEIADGHNLGKRLHRETVDAVGAAAAAIAEILLSADHKHFPMSDVHELPREPPRRPS